MPTFQVAHVREQNVDLIIVLLDSSFGHKTPDDQDAIVADLQAHAIAANLRGTVVPKLPETNWLSPCLGLRYVLHGSNHFRFLAAGDSAISLPVHDLRITAGRSDPYQPRCLVGIEN